MERPARDLHWHHRIGALIRYAVIEKAGIDRELEKILFLRLNDVAHIEQLVVPGLQRRKLEVGNFHHIRDDTAGHRRDCLLAQWRERNEAVIDLVAASLLVFLDHRFEGGILLFGKTLGEPNLRGRGRAVGDMGPRYGSGGNKPKRTVKHRTSR